MSANDIAADLISAAINISGDTWIRIQQSAPLYFKAYAQSLLDIAEGLHQGEISEADAKMYAETSRLVLVMAIANTSHIIFAKVQQFIDAVIDVARDAINSRLPVPIL